MGWVRFGLNLKPSHANARGLRSSQLKGVGYSPVAMDACLACKQQAGQVDKDGVPRAPVTFGQLSFARTTLRGIQAP